MPELLVDYSSIEKSKSALRKAKSETTAILLQFNNIRLTLDWDIKCEQQIDAKLLKIHNHINTLSQVAGQHFTYLENARLRYMNTEQHLQGNIDGVQSSLYSDASVNTLIDFFQKFYPEENLNFLDIIKFFMYIPASVIPAVIIELTKKFIQNYPINDGSNQNSGTNQNTIIDSNQNKKPQETSSEPITNTNTSTFDTHSQSSILDTKKVGDKVADISDSSLYKPHNNKLQCVGYVQGRIKEKGFNGKGINGDARNWLNNAKNLGLSTGREIKSNSVACFSYSGSKDDYGKPYGHVVFVEEVKDGIVYFSEANFNPGKDGVLQSLSIEDFEKRSKNSLQGYIYL